MFGCENVAWTPLIRHTYVRLKFRIGQSKELGARQNPFSSEGGEALQKDVWFSETPVW